MFIAFLQPLLADGFSGFACVAVIVMMFVGWILNTINASKRQTPAARRRPRPARSGDDRLQSEIDSFLQEVGGGKRRPQPSHAARDEDVELEIVDERESPRRRPRRRPQSRPAKPERPAAADVSTPLSERHLESAVSLQHLGGELQEHVDHYMQDHSSEAAPRSELGSDWTKLSDANAGGQAGAQPEGATLSGGIADLLRNPVTVQQAILVNEILSPPKSRRR